MSTEQSPVRQSDQLDFQTYRSETGFRPLELPHNQWLHVARPSDNRPAFRIDSITAEDDPKSYGIGLHYSAENNRIMDLQHELPSSSTIELVAPWPDPYVDMEAPMPRPIECRWEYTVLTKDPVKPGQLGTWQNTPGQQVQVPNAVQENWALKLSHSLVEGSGMTIELLAGPYVAGGAVQRDPTTLTRSVHWGKIPTHRSEQGRLIITNPSFAQYGAAQGLVRNVSDQYTLYVLDHLRYELDHDPLGRITSALNHVRA